jgi:hypothetical protein
VQGTLRRHTEGRTRSGNKTATETLGPRLWTEATSCRVIDAEAVTGVVVANTSSAIDGAVSIAESKACGWGF